MTTTVLPAGVTSSPRVSAEHGSVADVSLPLAGSEPAGMPGFTHQYADVNGTRLHYVSGGSGPAVMLLHGWPSSWLEWRPLMVLLADAGWSVIAPDLRGTGDSAVTEDGYSKANVSEDVRQLVQQLGHEQIRLVGTDIGTMVAFSYALAHPAEITHLVLSESLLPGFGLEEMMNPATGGFPHFGLHMQVDLAAMLTAGKEDQYLRPMLSKMSASMTQDDITKVVALYSRPGRMRAGFQHYGTLLADGAENRRTFTAPLTMPVLVLNGERGIPQKQLLAGVRQVSSRVEAALVPASAHTLGTDNPSWIADRLAAFFGS